MSRVGRVVVLAAVMLPAACTGSSDSTARTAASPESSASPAHQSKRGCSAEYPGTTATESSVAGDLRFLGPRPVNGAGHFAGLPDTAPVTLCLVPVGQGAFAVYGVPEGDGRAQQLWTQNNSHTFTRPG